MPDAATAREVLQIQSSQFVDSICGYSTERMRRRWAPLLRRWGSPQRCFPPCPHSQWVLAHGRVCKPFACECWLIRTERWPTGSCLRRDCWPTSARVCKPTGSCSQAATDIIACKEYPVITRYAQRRANLRVRLFTECKWILPTVSVHLNFLPKDEKLAINLAKDNNILRQQHYAPLEGSSGEPLRVHHYIQPKEVARTAICENKKGSNKDIFYEAWEQALHALLYYKHHTSRSRFRPVDKEFPDTTYTLDYPVVVVSSFDTFFKRDWVSQTSSRINDNFIWSVNYSYPVLSNNEQRHTAKDFFVDITSFPTFEGFLENLEQNDVVILKEKIWVNLMS